MRAHHSKKRLRILLLFCLLLFCISAVQVVRITSGLQKEQKALDMLAVQKSENQEKSVTGTKGENGMLQAYEALYKENQDLAGWIRIEGTKLNYPVMFTPETPEYYLHRSFDRSDSVSGVPFIGEGSSPAGSNVMVYGHHMKNGTMFAVLLKYAEEDFWNEHPVIWFDSLYEENVYEVVGAFYSRVCDQKENAFKYYEYTDLSSPKQFDAYLRQVKEASLYDTGIAAEYGEQILTLSTCSYHVKNGRFVVVARKIKNR